MNPFYLLFSFLFFTSVIFADDTKLTKLPVNAGFITALTADDSGVFVGSEDNGVFRYDNEGKITQWTTKNGLGDDNAYALAVDELGRLWVGHQSNGVSVFNGKEWKNYDVIDGPIGERIFDICPKDGDVWLATSAGITRYKIAQDAWEHYTRKDGLLEDQCSSLAFQQDGTLIIGTQRHGLAIFTRDKDGNYKHAKNITAPERFGPDDCSPVPLLPLGSGLPSNQINQVFVAHNDIVWIATTAGLVKSDASLTKLRYTRGRDYAAKVKGLYGGAPKEWEECSPKVKAQLLPEDYITCLAEDDSGTLWLGTRRCGFFVLEPKTGKITTFARRDYVSSILPLKDSVLFGLYSGGIVKTNNSVMPNKTGKTRQIYSVAKNNFASLPSPIKPLTVDELKGMQTQLETLNEPLPNVYAAYYGEDWKTKGDWVGQYGRQYTVMCAASSPFDQNFFPDENTFQVRPFIGIHKQKDDILRRWVHWIRTDNPKVMYSPLNGYRRQAEWDDHAENYPLSHHGPGLWYLLEVKAAGVHKVSMYFFNKDGHDGNNRFRDYQVEIYPAPRQWTKFDDWEKFAEAAEKQTKKIKPLAATRVRDFWGGVYKSFIVTGENKYFVRIDKNYSFNTILSSVCIDTLHGQTDTIPLPVLCGVPVNPPVMPEFTATKREYQAKRLWNKLDASYAQYGSLALQREYRIRAYQSVADLKSPLAEAMRRRLYLWDDTQRKEWQNSMQEAWRRQSPEHRSQQEAFLKTRENPWKHWKQ